MSIQSGHVELCWLYHNFVDSGCVESCLFYHNFVESHKDFSSSANLESQMLWYSKFAEEEKSSSDSHNYDKTNIILHNLILQNYGKANMIPHDLIAKTEQEQIKAEPSGRMLVIYE